MKLIEKMVAGNEGARLARRIEKFFEDLQRVKDEARFIHEELSALARKNADVDGYDDHFLEVAEALERVDDAGMAYELIEDEDDVLAGR